MMKNKALSDSFIEHCCEVYKRELDNIKTVWSEWSAMKCTVSEWVFSLIFFFKRDGIKSFNFFNRNLIFRATKID